MTGDAVGLPGFTEGAGDGFGVGSGAGADDEGADDGIDDGASTEELRFFLLSEDTPKTYPNAPAQAMTTHLGAALTAPHRKQPPRQAP